MLPVNELCIIHHSLGTSCLIGNSTTKYIKNKSLGKRNNNKYNETAENYTKCTIDRLRKNALNYGNKKKEIANGQIRLVW